MVAYRAYRFANTSSPDASYTKRKIFRQGTEMIWIENPGAVTGNKNGIRELPTETQYWTEFPLKPGANDLPPANHLQVLELKTLAAPLKDDQGKRWWETVVRVTEGENRDKQYTGWACEAGQDKVKLCTPWAWPGFEIIPDDNTKPAEWFAMKVDGSYDQSSGKKLLKLYFDRLDADKNGKIEPAEFMAAWQDTGRFGQEMSRQIIEHESEWGMPKSEWDALDAQMKANLSKWGMTPDLSGTWEKEKERIEELPYSTHKCITAIILTCVVEWV